MPASGNDEWERASAKWHERRAARRRFRRALLGAVATTFILACILMAIDGRRGLALFYGVGASCYVFLLMMDDA